VSVSVSVCISMSGPVSASVSLSLPMSLYSCLRSYTYLFLYNCLCACVCMRICACVYVDDVARVQVAACAAPPATVFLSTLLFSSIRASHCVAGCCRLQCVVVS